MLIVLPPSETKAPGGVNDPMELSFPELEGIRNSLIDALAHTPIEDMDAPASKRHEAEENHSLREAPVMPAIHRYTGVLYDALDAASLPDTAHSRLAVGSALFGLVRAGDMIPRYRLSAGSKVAGKTIKAWWGPSLSEVLEAEPFVVDLRSGAYQQLGPLPGAVTVRVERDGKVVSHFNKQYKGELARVLALGPQVDSVEGVADVAGAAGMNVVVDGTQLTLVV